MVVAWDSPGETFRDELYSEYKATRNPTPDDLLVQIPRVRELFDYFRIPILEHPNLEADDVAACLVHQILADPTLADISIRLVSKDKDLEQLLSDRVTLFDIHTDTEVSTATLLETKGITPAQVIDLLALTGDTADNVPGVPGIGPKTAGQLLQEFGSIAGIYDNLGKIKGKRRENLEAARESIPLSVQLVTLHCSTHIDFALADAARHTPATAKLLPFFGQLGFNRFSSEVQRLEQEAPVEEAMPLPPVSPQGALTWDDPSPVAMTEVSNADSTPLGTTEIVNTRAALDRVLSTLTTARPLLSVCTESMGVGRHTTLCGIGLAWEDSHAVYIPIRSPEPGSHLGPDEVIQALSPLFEREDAPKCGHNLKSTSLALRECGVVLRGVAFDSMLGAALLDSRASGRLDELALSRLSFKARSLTDLLGAGAGNLRLDQVPLDAIGRYAGENALIALRLHGQMVPELEERGMAALMRDVEAPLVEALVEMESNGILCDPEELSRQGELLKVRVDDLRTAITDAAGVSFDPNSPKQLAKVLYEDLGLAGGRKTKTGLSTDQDVLEKLAALEDPADPKTAVPRLILEYRQLSKLISTYLGNLAGSVDPRTGRIHTTFLQLMTATGRLASNNPNLQNIPVRSEAGRQIRRAFTAPPGYRLICADYSQVELRLLAHLSGDPALIEAFAKDQDIHAAVAAEVFGVPLGEVTREQRSQAKTINFGIVYGVTAFGLAQRIGGLDVKAATKLIAAYKERFSGIDVFLHECIQQAMDTGYVTTVLGRRRLIPEILASQRHTRSLGERLAINTVVQGSAADLIKVAMVQVHRQIERDFLPLKMLLQIHDELVMEAPAQEADELGLLVCRTMEDAMSLKVPLKSDYGIGENWMEAK